MSSDEEERQFDERFEGKKEEVINQEVTFRYVELYPEELKQHPVNVTLYGEAKVDSGLVKSILEKGLLEPLIITENDTIIHGNSRWLALLYINKNLIADVKEPATTTSQIKMKAKCFVATFKDENEEKKAIIEYNKDRKRLYSQKYNEIEMLHEIYDEEARHNSLFNLKIHNIPDSDVSKLTRRLRSSPAEITDLIDWSLTDEEIVDKYGYLLENEIEEGIKESNSNSIKTRDKIGKEIGMGGTNVDKLTEIGRLAKAGDEVGLIAMKNLDDGKWKINGAHIVVQMRKYFLSGAIKGRGIVYWLIEEVMNGAITPQAAKKEFDKLVPPLRRPKNTKTTIKSTYSIIFLDPLTDPKAYYLPSYVKSIDNLAVEDPTLFLDINEAAINYYMNEVDIPTAEDAALFLIANVLTLKDCFKLIRLWNFEIQSFAIMQPKQKGYGNWFVSGYDLLLFSTKGKWLAPAKENQFSGDIIQTYEDVYQVIEKMYPDVKSRYEVGKEKQHEGWGISLEYLNKPKVPEFKPMAAEDWKSSWQKQQELQKDNEEKDPDPNDLGRW